MQEVINAIPGVRIVMIEQDFRSHSTFIAIVYEKQVDRLSYMYLLQVKEK